MSVEAVVEVGIGRTQAEVRASQVALALIHDYGHIGAPWHNAVHGIIQTMCLCHRTKPSGAEGQEVCCKEPRDERGEAVHLCGVDWY